MADAQWFVMVDDKKIGPATSQQLKSWADKGRITRQTLVKKGDQSEWVLSTNVKGLFPSVDSISGSDPPPVPPSDTHAVDSEPVVPVIVATEVETKRIGTPRKKDTNYLRLICIVSAAVIGFLLVLFGGFLSLRLAPDERPPVARYNVDDFSQVGLFETDGMRGFTIYVPNPKKSEIRAFCDKMKRQYIDGDRRKRILKIHFYDNRAHTPNVSSRYYFPDSSAPYLVADYLNNPHYGMNGLSRLNFHKQVSKSP